ncbi:MAG: hypothetical protein ACP5GF_13300 [Thiomonas sp.]
MEPAGKPSNYLLVGLRCGVYTHESLCPFADRISVSKTDSWIDYGVLEQVLRDDLDARAPRLIAALNPQSRQIVAIYVESTLADASFQFERNGYFVADRVDHCFSQPVFKRTATLKNSWSN